MNIDQDRHMLMVDDNIGNQFRQNAVQNVGHLVWQNAVQNQSACEETQRANANSTLENNLQQASTFGTQFDKPLVYDSDGSTEVPQKVDKTNDLSNPVTSNLVPTTKESNVMNNEKVIALETFRVNPFNASRNDVSSKTNGFSLKDVKSTIRTRRPQPRNNPKSDKVPFKSKSSCLSNKLEKIKENHRSLQSSNYPDHTSSKKQLDKEEFQEIRSFDVFRVLMTQFQTFINFRYYFDNDEVKKRKDNSSKAFDIGLVITKSNETESERHVLSSRSWNDTHTDDVDINSVNDKQPMAEVQLSAEHNILANEQQHSEQSASVYDTYLLEKVDRNTTPESTDMSHKGGEIDQNADVKKYQVSYPLPDPSTKYHADSLIVQLNCKTVENVDLKAQIQEKVFANAALKNELRKSKGYSVDTKFEKPSILGKPVLQPPRNQSVVRQPTAFKSKRPNFLKPRFASQVDVNNVLSKPVTPHYLPKVRESAPTKPHHVNAPKSSRISQKESYGSNDMARNYYLEEAKKKTQDKNKNLKPREMPYDKTHHIPNACTLKPRSNNQTSRNWLASKSCKETLKARQKADHSRNPSLFSDFKHFVCSTCQKCVFNSNHDACITKFLKK
nr:hypothetical protein [Tanacetum cinerariifolium]